MKNINEFEKYIWYFIRATCQNFKAGFSVCLRKYQFVVKNILVILVSEGKYHIYFEKFEQSSPEGTPRIAQIFKNIYDILPHSQK